MTSDQINREVAAFQRDRDFYNQKVEQGFSIEMIELLLELDERCRREELFKQDVNKAPTNSNAIILTETAIERAM